MRFLSVCSGIEAASVAWKPLGWEAVAFAEIEPFPCSVLAHHYPDVPNHGDMTRFKEWPDASVELVVGGTPCQSFSVAGLRAGLDDPRGNLTLTYLGVVARYRPRWCVWENVPGVLSDSTGAFASFVGGLAELGYGWAYRILDAQFFGVPQRRRRVFVVGHLGDWRRAAAVLLERESLCGHPAPRREAGKGVAGSLANRARGGGGLGTDFDCDRGVVAHPLLAKSNSSHDESKETYIAHAFRADGFDASEDGTGRGTPLVACTLPSSDGGVSSGMHPIVPVDVMPFDTTQITSKTCRAQPDYGRECHTLNGEAHAPAIAYQCQGTNVGEMGTLRGGNGNETGGVPFVMQERMVSTNPDNGPNGKGWSDEGVAFTLEARTRTQMLAQRTAVRRLTPTECEALQGFPRNYTLVPHRGKPAADGPRYKALGNSFAVPVVRWIGERLAFVDSIPVAG